LGKTSPKEEKKGAVVEGEESSGLRGRTHAGSGFQELEEGEGPVKKKKLTLREENITPGGPCGKLAA